MSIYNIFNKNLRLIFLLIILAEILSFLGYFWPIINSTAFFAIIILTIILSLYRLEYGLYILLAELLIGSFGYLFYFENQGLKISIRLALWLIIMSVWLAKAVIDLVKTKKIDLAFFRSPYLFYFLTLFIFIAFGALNGWLKGNSLSNLFFDFNNWLYFLLVFPISSLPQSEHGLSIIKQIFLAGLGWLSVKTIILAYVFSHSFGFFVSDLYLWTRRSGVGEITQVVAGFSRIFMQSHIFVLLGFFILLFYLLKNLKEKQTFLNKPNLGLAGFGALLLSVIIISFSRSFWLGLMAGGLFIWLAAIFKLKIKLKRFAAFNLFVLSIAALSLGLAAAVIKFPYPAPIGGFDAANLLSDRATKISGEAGAASRWQLLTPLWQNIKTAPVLGRGFGATVTYKSDDPRALAANLNGEYTTYAFEWGWLDVWLKLGLLGLLTYLAIFIKLIYDGIKINSYYSLSLAASLAVIMAVNIFSPYVNHPLGIGFIILTSTIINFLKNSRE